MAACVEHGGHKDKDGYAIQWRQGKNRRAHRLAWEDAHGPIPVGMSVCHTCDNPPCVLEEHLFLGTGQDNTDDMIAKGRKFIPPYQETCLRGHDFDKVRADGARLCQSCAGLLGRRRVVLERWARALVSI